ncbi:hypothetical protein AOC36_07425 [Erysipelothrix larvae]|uniref:HTH tetR-type domain-containing protein n=1 Tax=Erysipelothrix larvae TaxID=1514105 RepID=A0A0X8H0G8_9FIRM|nr:TetR/AcrR family transcriptional regulator [Erysipelothrix larvae]AMC93819.1 hypothetical protein AOC36_07425 [Erysipelothrix larvae]
MDFQRARNAKQKDIRIHEITSATRELLEVNHFSTITLKKISDKCSFSRINLYNYFKTKEEIYLTIFLEDFQSLYDDMFAIFKQYTILNAETFASLWCETIVKHHHALVWYTLVAGAFEDQVSEEVLAQFKEAMLQILHDLESLICSVFPKLSDKDCTYILCFCLNFGSALFTTFNTYSHNYEVKDNSNIISVSPGFVYEYRENIIIFIRGMVHN